MQVYQACVDAGPSLCPLYEDTASAIDHRVKHLMAKLQHTPLPFYDADTGAYDTIDGGDVKKALFQTLFKPHILGKGTFAAFAELERGNARAMSQIYSRAGWVERMQCKCPAKSGVVRGGAEIQFAVTCGEGKEVRDGVTELRENMERMLESAPSFAGLWVMRVFCS